MVVGAASAVVDGNTSPRTFVTWEGIGPDKWASVWLILRHVDEEAAIQFVPVGSIVRDEETFDLPGSALSRGLDDTTFDRIIATYEIDDPAVMAMARIVRQMEIGRWELAISEGSREVEAAFRNLQHLHGRDTVPFGCYLAFFDRVEAAAGALRDDGAILASELEVPAECAFSEVDHEAPASVVELPPDIILEQIARGKEVVFVDAREPAEYAEYHIPGAINLQLRNVDAAAAESLAGAALVVPYCVKDFRGFEVARALHAHGLERVAIMNPYGIRGWVAAGLPVAGEVALSESDAANELRECAAAPFSCLDEYSQ